MDNSRFLKIIIIILLLINAGTLATVWIMKPPMPELKGMPSHGRSAADFIVHELQFDPQQRAQYEELINQHRQLTQKIHDDGRDHHRAFFALLHSSNADTLAAKKWADSIAHNQYLTEMATFKHFVRVRAICNPQQQEKFDLIIDEALRMMSPPQPGQGHQQPAHN